MSEQFGRVLFFLGGALMFAGLLFMVGTRLGLGRLPGDIVYKREGFTFYFPLATCVVLSVVLSVLLRLFVKR